MNLTGKLKRRNPEYQSQHLIENSPAVSYSDLYRGKKSKYHVERSIPLYLRRHNLGLIIPKHTFLLVNMLIIFIAIKLWQK